MPIAFKATAFLMVLNLFKKLLSVITKPFGTLMPILLKTFLIGTHLVPAIFHWPAFPYN